MNEDCLAILVPDGSYPEILQAILTSRRKSIGIREIKHTFIRDALHDSSGDAVELLKPFLGDCSHALVFRDLEGSGQEKDGAAQLEIKLAAEMRASGWPNEKSAAIVVDPEIEAWLRFDSDHLKALLRERARTRADQVDLLFRPTITEIIQHSGGLAANGKPLRPKEAFEELLREFNVRQSNTLFGWLAKRESLHNCVVPSFQRLIQVLTTWFPEKT